MVVSGVAFDSDIVALPSTTLGHIAGDAPGIVTLNNVPGVAIIDLIRRSDNAWLRRTLSAVDGTYRFTGLVHGVQYNVIGRDITNTWDDVIVGRVEPFKPLTFVGNAPGCVIGQPYLYAYAVQGGEAPYTFTLVGDLPDGLSLVTTGTTVQVSGTPSALAVDQTFEIQAEDVRGAAEAIVDFVKVYAAGAHRYWRVNITASNAHTSIAELEFAETPGGANLCVGGVAIAGDHYPNISGYNFEAANAFDGNFGNIVNSWAALNAGYGWLGYILPEPAAITEVRICPRAEGTQSPRDFTIESSDDGIAWTVEATYTSQTSWTFYTLTPFAV